MNTLEALDRRHYIEVYPPEAETTGANDEKWVAHVLLKDGDGEPLGIAVQASADAAIELAVSDFNRRAPRADGNERRSRAVIQKIVDILRRVEGLRPCERMT